jgi:uncharacterized protein
MSTDVHQQNEALPPIIRAMSEAGFYPHPAPAIELRQTHTSYVVLAGDFVYKIRKPVHFAFIDCSTPELRRELCESEVRLNRRLSPDVYLGVVPILRAAGRYSIGDSSDNAHADVTEFAVKMRRLPEERRLDVMIVRGEAGAQDIHSVAEVVGSFHARAPDSNSWKYGAAANIWRMAIANLAEIEQLVTEPSIDSKLADIEAYSRRFITGHWEMLNGRARAGQVREGHGDLRADAVYLTRDGIRIVDCLEFDERLRYGDIANEAGFLAMDLERLGRPDLSNELASYFAADVETSILLPFYKAYRATVRAKVEYLQSRQQECSDQERSIARANALRYLELALGYPGTPKALLVVCGASGTGKSTLARKLSEYLGFAIVNSDSERKQIAGIEPTTRAVSSYKQGIYTPEMTTRVYDALARDARGVLKQGKGVILDATFNSRHQRALVSDLARQERIEPLFIECRAEPDEVIRRLRAREQDTTQVSDAAAEIYLAQVNDFEPLSEISSKLHLTVDTAPDLAPAIAEVERRVFSQRLSTVVHTL